MDPKKLDKEILAKLPPELQTHIEEGDVIAVRIPQPVIRGTWFSALLAVILFCTAIPLFIPINAFMVVGNGLGMLGWFLSYAIADRRSCNWQTKFRIADGMLEGIAIHLEKSLQKQEAKKGTKSDSVCLKEEKASSDEVQGDGK
jgi:hypothetical protein